MRSGVIVGGSLGVWVMTQRRRLVYANLSRRERNQRRGDGHNMAHYYRAVEQSRQRDVRRDGVSFEGGGGEARRTKAS